MLSSGVVAIQLRRDIGPIFVGERRFTFLETPNIFIERFFVRVYPMRSPGPEEIVVSGYFGGGLPVRTVLPDFGTPH